MKKLICYISVLLVMAASCKKAESLMYSDVNRVQMRDTATINSTFVYDPVTVITDTILVEVNTIGDIANHDRPIKLVQVPEYDLTFVRDPITNVITDTIKTERPFKAQPGVHYVALDDKSLEPLMVVKANEVRAKLPIVLKRDASLKTNSYRLRLQLAANSEFSLGEAKAREITIVFSDRLERFYSWRVDGTQASAFNSFGKYSTAKHQFMIEVLETKVDEEWYQAIVAAQATQNYKNVFKEALLAFNSDPANIASGKAPLRESDAPGSAVVTFPN